jgi:AbrB family looped-hinge helix DNA binding protein
MSDANVLSVGPKGRIVIPVEIRRRLGLEEGSELVALIEGEGVMLLPRDAVKARLRDMFAEVGPSMADELVRDRRAAAVEESRDR